MRGRRPAPRHPGIHTAPAPADVRTLRQCAPSARLGARRSTTSAPDPGARPRENVERCPARPRQRTPTARASLARQVTPALVRLLQRTVALRCRRSAGRGSSVRQLIVDGAGPGGLPSDPAVDRQRHPKSDQRGRPAAVAAAASRHTPRTGHHLSAVVIGVAIGGVTDRALGSPAGTSRASPKLCSGRAGRVGPAGLYLGAALRTGASRWVDDRPASPHGGAVDACAASSCSLSAWARSSVAPLAWARRCLPSASALPWRSRCAPSGASIRDLPKRTAGANTTDENSLRRLRAFGHRALGNTSVWGRRGGDGQPQHPSQPARRVRDPGGLGLVAARLGSLRR